MPTACSKTHVSRDRVDFRDGSVVVFQRNHFRQVRHIVKPFTAESLSGKIKQTMAKVSAAAPAVK